MRIGNGIIALDRHTVHALAVAPAPSVVARISSCLRRGRLLRPAGAAVLHADAGEDTTAAESTPRPARASSLQGKRVLICEDEGISQMQLRRALAKAGMIVVGTAQNGQIAVDLAARERPDVILMDIRMPVMDGLEATRRIMSSTKTCVVMLTAFSDEEYQSEAEAAGASGYIVKPVTGETLVPHLEQIWKSYKDGE